MIDKKAKYGKVDRAIGSFFSKLLHNVPKRRGNTEVSDLITKNKNRFGPAEAGLMSGFGVNKLVSGPVNRTRVIDDLEFISKHDDVLRRVPERHLDDLVKQQTKGSIDDVTREVILEGSDVHHSNLYNRGDKWLDMPLKKDVFTGKKKLYTGKPNLSDKAVYNIAKFAPTALVAGAVGSTIKKETATQHTTIPTGWEGGDWTKQSSGNEILDKWKAHFKREEQ